ncbi:hypothetical protein K450DRAFT_262713 [Umbelopsis ramanniana AG]|uniref:Uncharacterized protein n=1 Tax=Umbelopsis ramanniana AG TaxID=1314678 RepID=A0AAD5E1W0_UMBRA|nr:uncharacterized protein K450DRAFT_262713 [Umbelopsis ramanniana AG]KAI8575232.1 hypothetical protein K450DRAFT_262713 [Umbelopsis ramanniana AG]
MFRSTRCIVAPVTLRLATRNLSTKLGARTAWLVTDGSLESHKQCTSMADLIHAQFQILQIKPNGVFQGLPVIIQKLLVETFPGSRQQGQLPSFLANKGENLGGTHPDILITCGRDAIAAALSIKAKDRQSLFSVYLGFPDIPFINFDHVILSKHEAASKLAKLGPLSSQKNYTTISAPLMNLGQQDETSITRRLANLASPEFLNTESPITTYVVGKHHHHCRWYPEDASLVADNIERIMNNLGHRVILVYTDKTEQKVKETIDKVLKKHLDESSLLAQCDLSTIEDAKEKCQTYDALVQAGNQIILTADLDYLVLEAVVKRYIFPLMKI